MKSRVMSGTKRFGISMLAAGMLVTAGAWAGDRSEQAPDSALSAWLGTEYTVAATSNEYMPDGGKLTFVFDAKDDVVRVCTRNAEDQKEHWKLDLAKSCEVTMSFSRGKRYCSTDDVKAGNAEELATCHRLRSRDVAMRKPESRNSVELNDLVAFLVEEDGKKSMVILVDSPSRMTGGGIIVVRP